MLHSHWTIYHSLNMVHSNISAFSLTLFICFCSRFTSLNFTSSVTLFKFYLYRFICSQEHHWQLFCALPDVVDWTVSCQISYVEALTPQCLKKWLSLPTGTLYKSLSLNEVIRMGPSSKWPGFLKRHNRDAHSQRKVHGKTKESQPLQVKLRDLRGNQTCWHPDLGLLVSRTVKSLCHSRSIQSQSSITCPSS